VTEEDLLVAVIMHGIRGIGQKRLWRLYELLSGDFHLLCTTEGWPRVRAARILPEAVFTAVQKRLAYVCAKRDEYALPKGTHVVWWGDSRYPQQLRKIPEPPFLLYARGDFTALTFPAVAVVGTRRPTAYGLLTAERFAREFVAEGATVISGMAFGIDAAAHHATLRARGRTVAVLASGVDIPTPEAHRRLYEEIYENGGLILSEMPPGTMAERGFFPLRNRLLSGISYAVLVVESRFRGGAMLTAEWAQKHGRPLFAIPGPVFSPSSEGPNRLLATGAFPALSAREVLAVLMHDAYPDPSCSSQASDELSFPKLAPKSRSSLESPCTHETSPPPISASFPESLSSLQVDKRIVPSEVLSTETAEMQGAQDVLDQLASAPRTVEELIEMLALAPAELLPLLVRLELAGVIRRLPGGRYASMGDARS